MLVINLSTMVLRSLSVITALCLWVDDCVLFLNRYEVGAVNSGVHIPETHPGWQYIAANMRCLAVSTHSSKISRTSAGQCLAKSLTSADCNPSYPAPPFGLLRQFQKVLKLRHPVFGNLRFRQWSLLPWRCSCATSLPSHAHRSLGLVAPISAPIPLTCSRQ